MFASKSPHTSFANPRDIRAFLEEGCSFEGKLTFSGAVRLNGIFKGEIETRDILIIGPSAKIEGILRVGSAILGGHVQGEIYAEERIEILPSGRFQGTLAAPSLVSHEGAELEGNFAVTRKEVLKKSKNTETPQSSPISKAS